MEMSQINDNWSSEVIVQVLGHIFLCSSGTLPVDANNRVRAFQFSEVIRLIS